MAWFYTHKTTQLINPTHEGMTKRSLSAIAIGTIADRNSRDSV